MDRAKIKGGIGWRAKGIIEIVGCVIIDKEWEEEGMLWNGKIVSLKVTCLRYTLSHWRQDIYSLYEMDCNQGKYREEICTQVSDYYMVECKGNIDNQTLKLKVVEFNFKKDF